jgi:sugar lactone lactonase YvrE
VRFPRFLAIALWFGLVACASSASFGQQTRALETPIDGPDALAIDHEGHLFVTSLYENNVRRIDLRTGMAETVAGNGKDCCYTENSRATDVSLETIWAIAVNSAGDLFISEGERILKVDARTGLISTVAGNEESGETDEGLLATSTKFVQIGGLAVDEDENLLAADMVQGKVFKIEMAGGPAGRVFKVAGSGKYDFTGDGGPAVDAALASPRSIVLDKKQNLIIADAGHCRIRRVDHKTGLIDTIVITEPLANCLDEAQNPLSFTASPDALAIDSQGNIVFAETAPSVVLRANVGSKPAIVVAGSGDRAFSGDGGAAADAALIEPSGLIYDSGGNLLISDLGNNRVRRVDAVKKTIQTILGNGLPNTAHVTL